MKPSSKKLLITGAYGLVGSNICKILEHDYPEIEITKLKCTEGLTGLSYDFDYVIFGAGYGQPNKFSQCKIETIQINTDHIMCAFSKFKLNGKFLYISTSEVYSGAQGMHKETDIGTTTPQHPRACYIEGKRCGEAICMAYKEQGYDVKIARLALAYGPGTKKYDTRAINRFIEQALTTKEIHLLDDGSAKRVYGYVEDCAQMMIDILLKGKDVVYNVGGTKEVTILQLAEMIASMTDAKVFKGDNPLEGAPQSVWLDMTKTIWEFPIVLTLMEDGLRKTIEYQKTLYV